MQTFLPPPVTITNPGPAAIQPLLSVPAQMPPNVDPLRASVVHLLNKAYALPCSAAANSFTQLVQPTARFQLALEVLLPLLESNASTELAQRILVSFILYSLYAPHPIQINPFKSALISAFLKERNKAVIVANEGGVSPNEQLVWVLWKILKGDGNDIGPYSPSTLMRTPIPSKLRPNNLVLSDDVYNSFSDLDDDSAHSLFTGSTNSTNSTRSSASSDSNDYSNYQYIRPTAQETQDLNEQLVQAMNLLLKARERVLNLTEQRAVLPHIPQIAASRLIISLDLTPIASSNPIIAHALFVELIKNASDDNDHLHRFIDVLPFLPPCLPTFDLIGRMLREPTRINIPGYSTIADFVRMELLGRFIHESIGWIERAEREQMEGGFSDDRVPKAIQNFCRFFNSLIKLRIVDPTSDADVTEMAHFSLRYSRFEEANALYRVIARGHF